MIKIKRFKCIKFNTVYYILIKKKINSLNVICKTVICPAITDNWNFT